MTRCQTRELYLTEVESERYIRMVMWKEDRAVKHLYLTCLRVGRRLGVTFIHRVITSSFFLWLDRNIHGCLREFLTTCSVRDIFSHFFRLEQIRRSERTTVFSTALH